VHFASSQGAKWLCAPLGSGFLYASSELPLEITPRQEGWFAMELDHDHYTSRDVHPKANANRFGLGTVPLPSTYGLRRACEVFLEAGPESCMAAAVENADRLHRAADDVGLPVYSDRSERRCAIIALELAADPTLPERLSKAKVVYSVREGKLRLSPHWYTLPAEIDKVCDVIATRD
jgi:selenocysteine lyase/cysteine desulfurase